MTQALAGTLSPTPHYYKVQGRAAEIARALGSGVGGAEHLFLAMLHDGGWPVTSIERLVDPGQAEAAVLDIINGPGYSTPPPPRFPAPSFYVQMWGTEVALDLGDSYLGVAHALLAMIRHRDTIPALALARLADLDALEADVLEALNAARATGPPKDAVFLPEGQQMDGPLLRAITQALPEGATFGFNHDQDRRTWIHVFGPGDTSNPGLTREVLNTALASLHPPTGHT